MWPSFDDIVIKLHPSGFAATVEPALPRASRACRAIGRRSSSAAPAPGAPSAPDHPKESLMSALFSILYGLASYGACLATLVTLIGFSGNLLLSKTVDIGAGAPWPEALATNLLLLALFALQHSVMARRGFKQWWTRVVPPAVERSTFVLATCAVLALLFRFWVPMPEPVVWQVEAPWAKAALWGLFGLGWVVLLVSTFLINHFELFGLHQVFARFTGRPMPEAKFATPFLYRYVRHPIYVGLLLGFWSAPVMTAGHLLFALGATGYILVGIWFEERDLVAQFGERYRAYRAQTGMLLPRPFARRGGPAQP
jgi:protein-S-isoprenylcysteine O-methyltransferase Ste14